MKIGTLTYHDTTNYGAVLQAFALQKKLEDLGYDSEIIDYKCNAITDRYKITRICDSKNIKQFIKGILTNKNNRKLKNEFEKFNKDKQNISNKTYNKNNIKEVNNLYDKFIVGSDQVWNLDLSGNDTTYMLDFVTDNKRKASYAASFGYKIVPSQYIETTKKNLSTFNDILVREEQGKKIVKDLINKDAKITVDPTLLFNKSEWINLMDLNNTIKINKDYILLYIIAPNKEIIKFTRRLAKDRNCKIIYINHSYKNILGMKNIKTAGPIEFLEYIKNAKYIVTTSFHGVAFSINFEKQFFYALSSEKNNYNSRIENLSKILNLENRKISKDFYNYSKIEYIEIRKKLEKIRNESIKILKEELEE